MAVLAIAKITTFRYDPYSGLYISVEFTNGYRTDTIESGPYSLQIAEPTLNTNLKNDVQSYMETNWQITFGITDVVQIFQKVSFI